MDNIYITVVDVPPHVLFHLVRFLEVFLSALYQLPLKWETSLAGYVTRCEASINMIDDAPTLLMKGVKWQPLDRALTLVGDFQLWDKWADARLLIECRVCLEISGTDPDREGGDA